jgi:hypothetical protein
LLVEELEISGKVTTMKFGVNIFAVGLDGFLEPRSDRRWQLDRNFELLTRYSLLEFSEILLPL